MRLTTRKQTSIQLCSVERRILLKLAKARGLTCSGVIRQLIRDQKPVHQKRLARLR